MGKIQVTESELKNLIRESVEEVLKEGIGADFDNLQKGIGKNLLGAAAASILPGIGSHIGGKQLGKAYDKGKGFVNNIRKRYNDYDNQVNQNQTLQQQVTDFEKQATSYENALQQIQAALTGPLKEGKLNEAELPSWYYTGRTTSPQQTTSTAQYTGNAGGTGGIRGNEPAQQQNTTAAPDLLSQVPQIVQQIQNFRMKANMVPGLTKQINGLKKQVNDLNTQNQQLTNQNQQMASRIQKLDDNRAQNNANQIASVNNTVGNLNQMSQKAMSQNQTQPGLTRTMTPGTAQA